MTSEFDDSAFDDKAFLEELFRLDRPISPPPLRRATASLSSAKKKKWLPKEEWIKQQPWYKPPKGRKSREPRRVKPGDWDEELSETENVLRGQKHRRKLKLRRRNASPEPLPFWEKPKPKIPDRPRGHRRTRVTLPTVEESFRFNPDLPEHVGGPGREFQMTKFLEHRRKGRETTPEWLEVPDSDRHKYRSLSYIDGRYMALKEDTLPGYDSEMTNEEEDDDDGGVFYDAKEKVNMGELFSFMRDFV